MKNKCKNCGTLTNNAKFCSRSCSAIYNNSPKGYCKLCNLPIPIANTYCDKCRAKGIRIEILKRSNWIYTTTIKDILNRNIGQQTNNYRQIRDHARLFYSTLDKPQYCTYCGYKLHYEVCHIKAIKDFDPETYIFEVNSADNLIALCKNHHWEFDNGYLEF